MQLTEKDLTITINRPPCNPPVNKHLFEFQVDGRTGGKEWVYVSLSDGTQIVICRRMTMEETKWRQCDETL